MLIYSNIETTKRSDCITVLECSDWGYAKGDGICVEVLKAEYGISRTILSDEEACALIDKLNEWRKRRKE